MSFVRAAVTARSFFGANARRYASTSAAKQPSNWGLYLAGAGTVGLGAYVYMEKTGAWAPRKKQEKSPLDPEKFVDFKLKKVEPYNHNTAKFVFELPENEASLLPVASCVVVKSEGLEDEKGKPIIRPYTPVSPSDKEGEFTFLVKKYPSGNMSKFIHEMKPGDTLSIKGPIPKWDYKANEFEEVGLVGGGSGITPLYQVLTHALADKTNKTKFTLVFSNVTEQDILLREEFDALQKKYPNTFKAVYVLDKPQESWSGPKGYVTADLARQYLPPAGLKDKVKIFVCGPPPQVAAIAGKKAGSKQGEVGGVLKELGYTEDQVYKF